MQITRKFAAMNAWRSMGISCRRRGSKICKFAEVCPEAGVKNNFDFRRFDKVWTLNFITAKIKTQDLSLFYYTIHHAIKENFNKKF